MDYEENTECDLIVNSVNSRLLKKGLNTNIYVIGLSGSGKSSTSQRLAELISDRRETPPQIFIVDSLLELLRALRKTKEGDIIIIEEVSVLFPSRRSMAQENVAINKVFDTIRKRLLCIISNAPLWNSIDGHMRAMGNIIIETLRINRTDKVVISKFHRLQTNPMSGKTYRHTMQRNGRDVSRMFTRKPNSDRWVEYEKSKDKFMEELYQTLETQQEKKKRKFEKENKRNTTVVVRGLTPRERQVDRLYNNEKMTQQETANKIGITRQRVEQLLKAIMKKREKSQEKRLSKMAKGDTEPIE